MLLSLILLSFAMIAFLQVPQLVRNKWWRDLAVYGFFYVFAFTAALFYALDLPFISPVRVITVIMQGVYSIFGWEISI